MLQAFARRQRITLNTVLQTAWAILLSQYNRQTDILFGITVSGRPTDLPGAAYTLGLFINTLPLRLHIDPNATLAACLASTQAQALTLQAYEFSPLLNIQRWSDLPPNRPLFRLLARFPEHTPQHGGTVLYN